MALIGTSKILILVLACFFAYLVARRLRRTPSAHAPGPAPLLESAADSRYQAGQVWSLRDAPAARLLVLRVEKIRGAETIVHVAVSEVPVPVGHMPFSEGAIDRSVQELLRTDPVPPEALEGYQEWRSAFDKGQAGVFTVSVPEALRVVG